MKIKPKSRILAGLLRQSSLFLSLGIFSAAMTSCAKDRKIELNQERTSAFDFFHAGEALESRGQFNEALAEYQKAWDLSPRPAFAFSIGELMHRMGNQEEAIIYYDRALTDSPGFEKAQSRKAQAELELSRGIEPDEKTFPAIVTAEELEVAARPSIIPQLSGSVSGSTAFESRDEAEIVQTLFPELDPARKNDPAVLSELAGAALTQQQFADAVDPLEQLNRINPSVQSSIDLARALYYSNQKSRSFEVLEGSLQEFKGDERLYVQLGRLLALDGQWEKSDEAIEEGIERHPESVSLRQNLAALRIDQNEFTTAVAILEDILKENPDDFITRYNLVIALLGEGIDIPRARMIATELSLNSTGRDERVTDLLNSIPGDY